MIISLWDEVANKRRDLSQEEFFEYLSSITMELFMPILDEYKDMGKTIVLYILHAYSSDSQLVIKGANWTNNKRDIANKIGLPDNLYDEVVNLKNKTFRDVMQAYLDYQIDRDFKHLMLNKEIYEKLSNTFMDEFLEAETLDFKVVNDKRRYKDEVLQSIKDMEAEMEQKYAYVYFGKEEIEKAEKKSNKGGLAIEDSNFIK
jgi:hypothetical protein